jgi:hypothetical protein
MFDELKSIPRSKDLSKPNPALDAAIEEIKSKYPHMFLQDHELKHRRFYDEPEGTVPMEDCLYPIGGAKPTKKGKK